VAARQNTNQNKAMKFLATEQNAVELLQSFAHQLGGRLQFFRF
jgi:hypothetical protein